MSQARDNIPGIPVGGGGAIDPVSANASELEAIRSLLAVRDRFVLASVICNDLSLQRSVITGLRASHPDIVVVDMSANTDVDPFSLADRQAPPHPLAVFVTGLTSWLSNPMSRLARASALNASRERWIERFHCPVLLWMNQTTGHVLAQHAPDVWRYRSHRFEFERDSARDMGASVAQFARSSGDLQSQTAQDARERIEELRRRLEAVPPDASPALIEVANNWRNEMGLLLSRLGELNEAERVWREALEIDRRLDDERGQAICLGNLGIVLKTRGELEGAEAMYRKSLAIGKKLGWLEGMANDYGNLGMVLRIRGELEAAEAMFRRSLAIEEKLGRLQGMASDYGNLGNVMKTRGDLEGAEAMFRKSLAIAEKLGATESMASACGNLGIAMITRGDLEGAEAMFRKSLAIAEKLGSVESMASAYSNLGTVLRIRGDLEGAEAMFRKSLAIAEKLGSMEGMASAYGNLGIVMKKRGDLEGAEAMCRKSLAIEEKLGRLEGMASSYANLGILLRIRGDSGQARELWSKSLGLYAKLGAKHMMERVQRLIDGLGK